MITVLGCGWWALVTLSWGCSCVACVAMLAVCCRAFCAAVIPW